MGKGYVRELKPYLVPISSKPSHNGLQIRVPFEDVRFALRSSLQQELDKINYVFHVRSL